MVIAIEGNYYMGREPKNRCHCYLKWWRNALKQSGAYARLGDGSGRLLYINTEW